MKTRNLLLIFVIIISFLLTACGGNSFIGGLQTEETPNQPPASETPNHSQEVSDDQSVSATAQGVTLTLNKSIYSAFENIIVTISGVTDEMINAKAFVSIHEAGANHKDYQENLYPKSNSDTLTFTAPNYTGQYEMRFYNQDEVYTDEAFLLAVIFDVKGIPKTSSNNTSSNDVTPAILVANEGKRIIFRLTSPDLQEILAGNDYRAWQVRFSLNGDDWSAGVGRSGNTGDIRVSVFNNPTTGGENAYARVFFEENDVIIDFLVYDNYSFNWNTLEITDFSVPVLTGFNYVIEDLVISDIKRPLSEIEQKTYPCITEIIIDPTDTTQTTLTAVRNANGTVTFTYNNKAIKHEKYLVPMEWFASPIPSFLPNTFIQYSYGFSALGGVVDQTILSDARYEKPVFTIMDARITINDVVGLTTSEAFNTDDWIFDLFNSLKVEYHPVTTATGAVYRTEFNAFIDENGLTITWTDEPISGTNLDELVSFLIRGEFSAGDNATKKVPTIETKILIEPEDIMR